MRHDALDRGDQVVDGLADLRLLLLGEAGEHVVDDSPARQRTADADAHAREVLVADVREDGLDAVVAARAALLADADRAGRDVHVIVHDDEVLGVELVPVHQRADGTAALIHVRLRLDEHDLLCADARVRDLRLELVLPVRRREPEIIRQRVNEHEADIVLRLRVLRTGVAKTCNDFHSAIYLLFLFLSFLSFQFITYGPKRKTSRIKDSGGIHFNH